MITKQTTNNLKMERKYLENMYLIKAWFLRIIQ